MEKRFIIYIDGFVLLFILLMTAAGCNRRSAVDEKMDLADSLMTSRPDSALAVLEDIPASDIKCHRFETTGYGFVVAVTYMGGTGNFVSQTV